MVITVEVAMEIPEAAVPPQETPVLPAAVRAATRTVLPHRELRLLLLKAVLLPRAPVPGRI